MSILKAVSESGRVPRKLENKFEGIQSNCCWTLRKRDLGYPIVPIMLSEIDLKKRIILEKTKLFITIGVSQKRSIFGHFWQIFESFFKKLTFLTKPLSESKVGKHLKNRKSENPVEKWYNCAKNVGKLVLLECKVIRFTTDN